MWISPKTLRLPILASSADSKLLDFCDSMTSCINRTLCVMRYIRYVRINACAVGTFAIIVNANIMPSSLAGELSTDEADNSGFFSTRRICMISYRFKKMTSSSLIGNTAVA